MPRRSEFCVHRPEPIMRTGPVQPVAHTCSEIVKHVVPQNVAKPEFPDLQNGGINVRITFLILLAFTVAALVYGAEFGSLRDRLQGQSHSLHEDIRFAEMPPPCDSASEKGAGAF